jgi:hypothetical protein
VGVVVLRALKVAEPVLEAALVRNVGLLPEALVPLAIAVGVVGERAQALGDGGLVERQAVLLVGVDVGVLQPGVDLVTPCVSARGGAMLSKISCIISLYVCVARRYMQDSQLPTIRDCEQQPTALSCCSRSPGRTREKLAPRRGADMLRVVVAEPDARCTELVDMWCADIVGVIFVAVAKIVAAKILHAMRFVIC